MKSDYEMNAWHSFIYLYALTNIPRTACIYLLTVPFLIMSAYFLFFFQKFGVPNWNQRTGPCVMVSWTAPGPGSPDNSRVQPFYWIIVLVALFFL